MNINNTNGIIHNLLREFDDKSQAILSLAVIAVCSMVLLTDSVAIITGCIGGISGLAMGKKENNKKENN